MSSNPWIVGALDETFLSMECCETRQHLGPGSTEGDVYHSNLLHAYGHMRKRPVLTSS